MIPFLYLLQSIIGHVRRSLAPRLLDFQRFGSLNVAESKAGDVAGERREAPGCACLSMAAK